MTDISQQPSPEVARRQHLVRMGKGMVAQTKPIHCAPYMGSTGKTPFDPVQARLNKEAGLCR